MNTQRVEGHTPIPWKRGTSDPKIYGADNEPVARAWHDRGAIERDANAAFIVHAVNNIERLEKVNEALVEAAWNRIEAGHDDNCPGCFMGHQKCTCGHDELLAAWKLAKEPA